MLHPTANELSVKSQTKNLNRYEVTLATAKCARRLTDEYVRQHDKAEKELSGSKDGDKVVYKNIDPELRDKKAVQLAVERIDNGDYVMVRESDLAGESANENL